MSETLRALQQEIDRRDRARAAGFGRVAIRPNVDNATAEEIKRFLETEHQRPGTTGNPLINAEITVDEHLPGTKKVRVPPKRHLEKVRRRYEVVAERADLLQGLHGKTALKKAKAEYEPGEVGEFIQAASDLIRNLGPILDALEDGVGPNG